MEPQLKRELGLFTCILLVIGNIIGVGIFTTPGEIARDLPTAGWVLIAWLIGGLMAIAGALTYAELGAMMPKAGGNYVFLKEAYGPLWGFLYGWAYSLVTTAGTIALLAIGFGEYLGITTGTWTSKIFSIIVILVVTFINMRGVKLGGLVMDGITLLKIAAMLFLVFLGLFLGNGHSDHFSPFISGNSGSALLAIAAALVPMAFAYSGWNSTVIVAEEVKDPGRLIPLSLFLGTLITTIIYILMNVVYLYAMPLTQLVGEVKVAHAAAGNLFGPWATRLMTALVATSVLGCLTATMLSNTRTVFALSRDGYFFPFAGKVHPTYGTPNGAILFEGLWACVLVLIGNFETILRVVSVPLVIISTMTVLSIFVFRRKNPDMNRPYKCWGYPVVPAIYVLISFFMLYATVIKRGIYGPIGILVFILGIPVYYIWKSKMKTELWK
ncbi:MAG: APC family permease [Elusimicrobiota bacterium]